MTVPKKTPLVPIFATGQNRFVAQMGMNKHGYRCVICDILVVGTHYFITYMYDYVIHLSLARLSLINL